MSILKRWDEDYNNNTGIPWSEFVKTVDKSNYSPELFNDNGDDVDKDGDEDVDLYPEDDNLYSDEEIAAWEKERAVNKKSSEEVEFITVHPNGGEGHVIALDDEKKVVSPDAGDFKGTTLSSAKSVGLDELEKKSSEKSSKKGKFKSEEDDDPVGVEKGSKEYYQAKVDKYEKRLKMYAMKMEELQKKIDSGDSTAADELEKYKTRQARVEKKLAGYKKNLEKFSDSKPSEDVKKEEAPSLSKSKSEPTSSTTDSAGKDAEKHAEKSVESSPSSSKSETVNGVSNVQEKLEAIESAMAMPGDDEWEDSAKNNIKSVNRKIKQWNKINTPESYQSAIEYYTKGDYRSFNQSIVGSKYKDTTYNINLKNAERFDKLFNDPECKSKGDVVLFRAMNSRHLPKDFMNGVPYVDDQIVSTSSSHTLTHMWHKANKCELAIYLPKGSTAVNVSKLGQKGEEETILPPNTAYKFIGVVGYRKSLGEPEPHPVYAVEAYTPLESNIRKTIDSNRKLLEEVRSAGKMPSEFHKGLYSLSELIATGREDFKYAATELGSGVSENDVLEYYNKYKHLYIGGSATQKGAHSGWKKQLELSDADAKAKKTSLSSSKSDKVGSEFKAEKPSDLDKILQEPDLYGIDTLESAAKSLLGEAGGSKWFDTYKNWYTSSMSDKLGAKFLALATEYLKYYTKNEHYDPWNIKGAGTPA